MRTFLGAAALVAVLVSGCGSESPARPTAAELDQRAKTVGVSRTLVHVTPLPGYARAAGGMGPYGDSGFQDIYTSPGGGDVRLTVERRSLTTEQCLKLPIPAAEPAGARVWCIVEGADWYRVGGGRHEYALVKGPLLIRVSGMRKRSSRALLTTAAREARPATPAELADMLPTGRPAPARSAETGRSGGGGEGELPERGDLPDTGDGAPDNEVGPGG